MNTEFSDGTVAIRVDGDVLEVLLPSSTMRTPLSALAVRLDPAGKSAFNIAIGRSNVVGKDGEPLPVGPLYGWGDFWMIAGTKFKIGRDEEPNYRSFFAEIAPLCDGREVQEPPPPTEKRGLFGRKAT